jgi:soluble lytic murein transglycosylase
MNFASWENRKIFYIVFGMVLCAIVLSLIFKPALKCFYPVKYMGEIEEFSQKYGIKKELVTAMISTESKFRKNAVSHKNAKGLMQLKEETAKWCIEKYGIDENDETLYSPRLNIEIGCAYMHYLLDKFGGNTLLALAAYNAGEGNVLKWVDKKGKENLEIPFKETKNYVKLVENREKIYRFLYY